MLRLAFALLLHSGQLMKTAQELLMVEGLYRTSVNCSVWPELSIICNGSWLWYAYLDLLFFFSVCKFVTVSWSIVSVSRASLTFRLMPQSNAVLDCSPIAAAGHVIPQSYQPISVSRFMDDLSADEDVMGSLPDKTYVCYGFNCCTLKFQLFCISYISKCHYSFSKLFRFLLFHVFGCTKFYFVFCLAFPSGEGSSSCLFLRQTLSFYPCSHLFVLISNCRKLEIMPIQNHH